MAEIILGTVASINTPAAGTATIAVKTVDGKAYIKNSAGVETVIAEGGIVGTTGAVYLAPPSPTGRGDDLAGTRGDPSKPYSTLKAALNNCQSGDVLYIAAGTYSMGVGENPIWPAGLDRLTIVGEGSDLSGVGGTQLINTAADGSHIFNPPNTADYIDIRNLSMLVTAGTGRCLNCDGTGGGANNFLGGGGLGNGGLFLHKVTATNAATNVAVTLKYVGLAHIWDSSIGDPGTVSTLECLTSNIYEMKSSFASDVSLTWDDSATTDKPALGNLGLVGRSSEFGPIRMGGQARIDCDRGCSASSLNGSLVLSAGISEVPSVEFFGRISVVDFQTVGYEFPDVANCRFDMSGAEIASQVKLKVKTFVTNRLSAVLRGAILPSGSQLVVADDGVDLDAYGATYPLWGDAFATLNSGKLRVHQITRTHTTDASQVEAIDICQARTLTFLTAPENVQVTGKSLGLGDVVCSASTTTQVTIEYELPAAQLVYVLSSWNT